MKVTKKQTFFLFLALLALIALFAGAYTLTAHRGQAGSKTITVKTSFDNTAQSHTVVTKQEFLGPALVEGGFVEGENGSMGLFIVSVDGRAADGGKQEWWCITKGGVTLNTGSDTTPIADGDSFELTLKTGF